MNNGAISAQVPWWYSTEEPLSWDMCQLGGEWIPGKVSVSGSGIKRNVDVKKSKGKEGATITDQGADLARFTLTVQVWGEQDWQDYQNLLATINPRAKGSKISPVEVVHPAINLLGVKRIYIDSIGVSMIEKGILTQELSAIEWVDKPPSAKTSPKTKEAAWDEQTAKEQQAVEEETKCQAAGTWPSDAACEILGKPKWNNSW
ncbi:MAG: hypothetical protein AB1861_13590 [Cyanobacteriota bacterium]